jgi:uncharacterized membrane protein
MTATSTTGLSDLIGKVRETAAKNPASERLLKELEGYLGAQAHRVLGSLGDKLGETTNKLGDVAKGVTEPGSLMGNIAKEAVGGDSGPVTSVAKAGLKGVAEKVKSALKGGGGSAGGQRSMNIIEDLDVGVPVHVAYNQWTVFNDFPRWSKGAKSVQKEKDNIGSKWTAKVAFSTRNWSAKITEQVPDERIAWRSEGPKGVVNGVVTFHPLGDQLTKVLLVLQYIPGGIVEKTGNLWRAQGRRARLDLKLFRHFVMTNPEAGQDGWRGEIRDGEVVLEHEEAEGEEQPRDEEEGREEEGRAEEGRAEEEPEEEEERRDRERDQEPAEAEAEEDEEEEPRERRPARRPAHAGRR